MSNYITEIAGTPIGSQVAMILALSAAILHAVFGALQKGRYDPWLSRGVIDLSYGIIAAPFALFLMPWPEPHMWFIFAGMVLIHVIYKLSQAMAYSFGAYTVVYPLVRGIGPLITVVVAGIVFGESFTLKQWVGVLLLSCAILSLALVNLYGSEKFQRKELYFALSWAIIAGIMVAAYTTYDAYGIRLTADPFTFLAWFFFLDGILVFPWIALARWQKMEITPKILPLIYRGIIGGFIAIFSFGSIMIATRLDSVGEAAVIRETSTVFAAIIGWIFLKETVGPFRAVLMGLIALGAVIVEFGG